MVFYNPTCGPYEIRIAKEHTDANNVTSCVGAYLILCLVVVLSCPIFMFRCVTNGRSQPNHSFGCSRFKRSKKRICLRQPWECLLHVGWNLSQSLYLPQIILNQEKRSLGPVLWTNTKIVSWVVKIRCYSWIRRRPLALQRQLDRNYYTHGGAIAFSNQILIISQCSIMEQIKRWLYRTNTISSLPGL